HHFSGGADLVHLGVEVGDGLHQRFALTFLAGHAVCAPKQAHFDRVAAVGHVHPGSRDNRPSRRAFAVSIFSSRRLASLRAAASCFFRSLFSARSRSHSETNCATFCSSEVNSVSTAGLSDKIHGASSSNVAFCMYFMILLLYPRAAL